MDALALSLPGAGTVRRAKNKLLGPSQMKDDPLQVQSMQLAEYEALIISTRSCLLKVTKAFDDLAAAPAVLFEPLEFFFNEEDRPQHRKLVDRFRNILLTFSARSKDAESHIEAIRLALETESTTNRSARAAITERDKQHQNMSHYQYKVDTIMGAMGKSEKNVAKFGDKLTRNQEKQRSNEQMFERSLEDAARCLDDALCNRYQQVAETMARLASYFAAVFDSSETVFQEMRMLSKEFVSPSNDLSLPGRAKEVAQEYTQAAKHRITSISSGMSGMSWPSRPSNPFSAPGDTPAPPSWGPQSPGSGSWGGPAPSAPSAASLWGGGSGGSGCSSGGTSAKSGGFGGWGAAPDVSPWGAATASPASTSRAPPSNPWGAPAAGQGRGGQAPPPNPWG